MKGDINTDQFASCFTSITYSCYQRHLAFSQKRGNSIIGSWVFRLTVDGHEMMKWHERFTLFQYCFTSFHHSTTKKAREIRIDKVYAVHILKWWAGTPGVVDDKGTVPVMETIHFSVTGSKQARLAKSMMHGPPATSYALPKTVERWDMAMTPSEGTLKNSKEHDHHKIYQKGRCVRAFALANCARDATHQQQGFGSHEAFPTPAAKTLGAFPKHMLAFWPIPERRAFTSFCFRMFWCFGLSLKEVVLWPVDFSSIELPKPLQKKASHSMESGVPAIPKNATVEVIVEVYGSLWWPFMDRHVESSQMLLNSVWLILFHRVNLGL